MSEAQKVPHNLSHVHFIQGESLKRRKWLPGTEECRGLGRIVKATLIGAKLQVQ